VRVLEVASLFAAPLMGAMLGDLGADVVKIEPPGGDQLRILGARDGRPGVWTLSSRNKRMVTVDTSTADGLEVLHRLTAVADVVTLNHPRHRLEALGCTYEDIARRNPRAVVVNLSAFGPTGPYADRPGNGSLAEAFGGLSSLVRDAEGRPMLTPILFGDHLAALAGVIGTIAACYWRDARGGEGQYVDLTMYEAVMTVLGPQVLASAPGDEPRRPGGLRGTFRTADGTWVVATAYSDTHITRLLNAVGVVPGDGPAPDLGSLVADWIAGRDRASVLAALAEAGIHAAPINDFVSLVSDPQVRYRESVVQIEDEVHGPVGVPGPVPRLSRTPAAMGRSGRGLGVDTADVLADWLGPAEPGR
jgi:formyl-CoA transferase